MTVGWRAGEAEDALQVDVYLESLLDGRDRRPRAVDDGTAGHLDADERRAAQLLAGHLHRFHPSFRFEDALAARLRAAAAQMRGSGDSGTTEGGRMLAFPAMTVPAPRPVAPGSLSAERRRVLIGGAIASGVSLAGAAIVAWRASTPPRTAFGRATRAAHRARPSVRGRA